MGIMDLLTTMRSKDIPHKIHQTTPEPPSATLHPLRYYCGFKISSFQTPSTAKHFIIPILEMALKKLIDIFLKSLKVVIDWETRGRQWVPITYSSGKETIPVVIWTINIYLEKVRIVRENTGGISGGPWECFEGWNHIIELLITKGKGWKLCAYETAVAK